MKKLLWVLWKYEGSASSAALYYDAKVREALCLVFERHRKLNEKTKASISSTDVELLKSLGLYINDHYADKISIESLARIACMGTTKLKSSFKAYYGMTVADYIQKVRIDHAEHLLAYTDLPVSEVATIIKNSSQYFTSIRLFLMSIRYLGNFKKRPQPNRHK